MQEIKTFEDRKNELVKLGKEKGLITYEQLAGALKGLDLDSDSLDELYNAFNENNIAVVSEDDTNTPKRGYVLDPRAAQMMEKRTYKYKNAKNSLDSVHRTTWVFLVIHKLK